MGMEMPMDKSQQIKRIRALVESLKNANAELNDQDMLDDEDRVLQEQIIGDGQVLVISPPSEPKVTP